MGVGLSSPQRLRNDHSTGIAGLSSTPVGFRARQTGVWAIAFLAAEIKIGRMEITRLRAAMQNLREERFAILPSLLLCDFGNLQREIERLTSVANSGAIAGKSLLTRQYERDIVGVSIARTLAALEPDRDLRDTRTSGHRSIRRPPQEARRLFRAERSLAVLECRGRQPLARAR